MVLRLYGRRRSQAFSPLIEDGAANPTLAVPSSLAEATDLPRPALSGSGTGHHPDSG